MATTTPRRPAASATSVLAWEYDPGAPDTPNRPVARPIPDFDGPGLRFRIKGRRYPAREYRPGTYGFRYWASAEALRRAADLWAPFLPQAATWVASVGETLVVDLDAGEDTNALYDRRGLHFFHEPSNGTTVYSGESPNVGCHELGHAVLDLVRPQLFHAGSLEAAAFHESFGDITAMLTVLQLQSVREAVLLETRGKLYRASRLSRLGGQLAWAIRQDRPDLTEPDCLRSAVNSFFYQDPATLPAAAPAAQLSSEPHSFSRVFTGAFLQALAGMLTKQPQPDEQGLLTAATHAAHLLIEAARDAPVVSSYYSQVAAHMIAADADLYGGRYNAVLKCGFLPHGIVSLDGAMSLTPEATADTRGRQPDAGGALPMVRVAAAAYGLGEDLLVKCPAQTMVYDVAGAAPDAGAVTPPSQDEAVRWFLEDMFRRGRVELAEHAVEGVAAASPLGRKSHELRRQAEGLVLRRRHFDCGFGT